MEEMSEPLENSAVENFELQLNESAKRFLKEAVKWAYFLSILGYVGIGFIVLLAIFAGSLFAYIGHLSREMGNFGVLEGSFISVLYFMMAAIYFFPIYYLNKFASKAKHALRTNDSESLATSFEYLKSHYKFFGIISLIILCLYALIIIFVVVAALAVNFR